MFLGGDAMQQFIKFAKENQNEYFDVRYEGKSCKYTRICTKLRVFTEGDSLVIILNGSTITMRFKEIKDFYTNLKTATIVLNENEKIFLKTY